MKANWKDYLKQNVLFILVIVAVLAAVVAVALILPLALVDLLPMAAPVKRFLTVVLVTSGVIMSALADLFAIPIYFMKMTRLYYWYGKNETFVYKETDRTLSMPYKVVIIAALVAVFIADCLTYSYFDQLFPLETKVKVIAHRAGGNEGAENTLSGLEKAWQLGAYGSEIDIQRTKDGFYILNHDSTFKRVAGDSRRPEDMTLLEIRRLSVDGEPVPTFEEMLLACKGRMVLFAELKGNTADQRMADDAVALVRQFHMEDECVLISLQYDIIDYIETTYPEIRTGFLTFASVGKTAELNCDYIGLEEESATTDAITSIHDEGKKVLVWTANDKSSQKHFLCTLADGIITDNVSQARELMTDLEQRSDLARMIDKIKAVI